MEREYSDRVSNDVKMFIGTEIEKTPAYGMKTLFVVGVHTQTEIAKIVNGDDQIEHIFFGANHSFDPKDYNDWIAWESMIKYFLDRDIWCSLDIPADPAILTEFNDTGLNDSNYFIPQIRVPIPYTKLWNYNTMIKIDDVGFNKTNPGIWTHSLHDLKDRKKFTRWEQYRNDKVIK